MSEQEEKLGPDFARGVPLEDLAEGRMVLGQFAGEAVVLARCGGALFAIGAECTHYHGPLAEGMLVADTVRCPWHHACFSLRTGAALRAPALDPVACWRVDQQDGKIYVRDKLGTGGTRGADGSRCRAGFDRYHRRRCGRKRRGRDAAARGLLRPGHDAERR